MTDKYKFETTDRFQPVYVWGEDGGQHLTMSDNGQWLDPLALLWLANQLEKAQRMALEDLGKAVTRIKELEAEVRQLTDELYEREMAKANSTKQVEVIYE